MSLWAIGGVLIVVGYLRGRGPWTRYLALREQDANADRYAAWRGGAHSPGEGERTGASVAMEILRRQARTGAIIALIGFVFVFAGFLAG
jgi:hypothetical protein